MAKFNLRDIPNRAHYDRLQTWALDVLSREDVDLDGLQRYLYEYGKGASRGDDSILMMSSALAELGFCAIIDRMAELIEEREGENNGQG